MRTSIAIGLCLAVLTSDLSFADTILCPTQKQSNCNEIFPATAQMCSREFCNVVLRAIDGKNVCMWTCAAHLNLQKLLNAYKASKAKE
jgi:hypothetical protein